MRASLMSIIRKSSLVRVLEKSICTLGILGLAASVTVTPAVAQGVGQILQLLGTGSNGNDGLTQQILRSLGQSDSQISPQLQPNIQIQNPQLQNLVPGSPFNPLRTSPVPGNNVGLSP